MYFFFLFTSTLDPECAESLKGSRYVVVDMFLYNGQPTVQCSAILVLSF